MAVRSLSPGFRSPMLSLEINDSTDVGILSTDNVCQKVRLVCPERLRFGVGVRGCAIPDGKNIATSHQGEAAKNF